MAFTRQLIVKGSGGHGLQRRDDGGLNRPSMAGELSGASRQRTRCSRLTGYQGLGDRFKEWMCFLPSSSDSERYDRFFGISA